MIVELLCIGDELLNGKQINSNSQFIGYFLQSHGLSLQYQQTLLDDEVQIAQALQVASQRSDVVLSTGGLGPTSDDKTFESVAKFLNLDLELNLNVEKDIQDKLKKRDRPYALSNRKQAMLPKGAIVLDNLLGTAPGIMCAFNAKKIICMPGVPSEMKAMMEGPVLQIFRELDKPEQRASPGGPSAVSEHIHYQFLSVSESQFCQDIESIFDKDILSKNIHIAYTAKYPILTVSIRFDSTQLNHAVIEKSLAAYAKHIMLKSKSVNDLDQGFASSIVETLKQKNLKVSFAESCTGGMATSMLLDVSGSSAVLEESLVCYSNEVKMKRLAVLSETLQEHGAVSQQCAQEMALGMLEYSASDIAIAITGIAGPGGGTKEKPVGTVFIAMAVNNEALQSSFESLSESIAKNALGELCCKENILGKYVWVQKFVFGKKNRQHNRLASVQQALKFLKDIV